MNNSVRSIRDRICNLMNTSLNFEQIEQMNPLLGKNINNVTGDEINNILLQLGCKPIFLENKCKMTLTDLGYPPKPDIVVAFHILNEIYEPYYQHFHDLKL